jgi:hypothetical protein
MVQNPALAYYAHPGICTTFGPDEPFLQGLPTDTAGLCEVLHGAMVHVHWARRYGLDLTETRAQEVNLRRVDRQIQRLQELDDAPLCEPRPLEKRLVGNCRDFSTMLAALLRRHGTPARARCGFGVYFLPDHFEDHWMCEVWDAGQERWVQVDPQIDALQREVLGLEFDPLELPPGQFWTAGQAWQACRAGEQDPDRFGIFDMHGLGFIQGNLIRDVLALNKVELLPWDWGWGLLQGTLSSEGSTPEQLAELDRLAKLALEVNERFDEVIAEGHTNPGLQLPAELLAAEV